MPEPRIEPRIVPSVAEQSDLTNESPMDPDELENCQTRIKEWIPNAFNIAARVEGLESGQHSITGEKRNSIVAVTKGYILRLTSEDSAMKKLFMSHGKHFWDVLTEEIDLYLDANSFAAE